MTVTRDPAQVLAFSVELGSPLVVIFYSAPGQILAASDFVNSALPPEMSARSVRTTSEALDALNEVIVLSPLDELSCVRELDRWRSRLLERTAPLVLYLLRGGEAERALRDLPGLRSVASGEDIDPEVLTLIDPVAYRQQFENSTGVSPEAWLTRYRDGMTPDDDEHEILANMALFLEKRP